MKKLLINTFVCICSISMLLVYAYASNLVDTIRITATVYDDGSMHIKQVWNGSFNDGTENYIPMNAPDYLTISDLKVADENGEYRTLDEWDIHKSFDEKANTCGINYTDNGYEICFGISEYGNNTYTIEYTLQNAIASYNDMDGVNFRFVNDYMNTTPTDVRVTINLANGKEITDEIADIWAFGYEGTVLFDNGNIVATTDNSIDSDNHITIMFAFNKGIINPIRTVDDSFETVKDTAFKGSDYTETLFEKIIGFIILIMITVVLPISFIIWLLKFSKSARKRQLKKFEKTINYHRDIPNEKSLNTSFALGNHFEICDDSAIVSTGMLRLINNGMLAPIIDEKVGFFGKTSEEVSLKLMPPNHSIMNTFDEYLYTILESASSTDGILQKNELGDFAERNYKTLENYINTCKSDGENNLEDRNCFMRLSTISRISHLTDNGKKELTEFLGFKKYLEDFSLINERGVKEIPIWKDLLIYAMLFGIADKVIEQFKNLYPNISMELQQYSYNMNTAYTYQHIMYSNMRAARQAVEAKRIAGSGGSSSFGGGGGSIGGGSGGGSR